MSDTTLINGLTQTESARLADFRWADVSHAITLQILGRCPEESFSRGQIADQMMDMGFATAEDADDMLGSVLMELARLGLIIEETPRRFRSAR